MIGVFFATEMEAAPFRALCQRDEVLIKVADRMGMGAAEKAVSDLMADGADVVINAGVCGALNDSLERGGIYLATELSIEEKGEGGRRALVLSLSTDYGCETVRLVSVHKPVFEVGRKRALAEEADIVDMEGFAVALKCTQRKIPCLLVKGVTDFGDGSGKQDIKEQIGPVSQKVAETVMRIVDQMTTEEAPPSTLQKLHSFTKIEHTLFSLPLLFAGAWLGAGGWPAWQTLLWIVVVGVGARTFGMAMNRILDRKIDAQNPRTKNRELPSGALSVAQGVAVALVGMVLYLVGCAGLGRTVLLWSWLPLLPLSIYSLLKRFTPLCHYGIGICLAAAPMGAFVAVTNSLSFSREVLFLGVFTGAWISGFDIIYALMDREFDQAHGVKSVPASLGEKGALWVAGLTHVIAIGLLLSLVSGGAAMLAAIVAIGAFVAGYLPMIPVPIRFFPISAIAGIAGAVVVFLR